MVALHNSCNIHALILCALNIQLDYLNCRNIIEVYKVLQLGIHWGFTEPVTNKNMIKGKMKVHTSLCGLAYLVLESSVELSL